MISSSPPYLRGPAPLHPAARQRPPPAAGDDAPLPVDPGLDLRRPPETGGLAWLLAHRLEPAGLQDITVERLDGRDQPRPDAGVDQAWRHAQAYYGGPGRHAGRTERAWPVASRPASPDGGCFAPPRCGRAWPAACAPAPAPSPPPAPMLAVSRPVPSATCRDGIPPAAGLSPVERQLNDLVLRLTDRFIRNLGMEKTWSDDAPDTHGLRRLLRQGAAVSWLMGQPLGGNYWRRHGGSYTAEEAAEWLPEKVFRCPLSELEWRLELSTREAVEALGEPDGQGACPVEPEALHHFGEHVHSCFLRLYAMGQPPDPDPGSDPDTLSPG